MKIYKERFFWIIPFALVIVLSLLAIAFNQSHKETVVESPEIQFAEADTTLADGTVELCSDYANLCFVRPADWTRSTILHAGSSQKNNIEINPPTGTILRFEAVGSDTNNICQQGAVCTIRKIDIDDLNNDLYLVSGIFEINPDDPNALTSLTAFVQLVDSAGLKATGLEIGKTTAYYNFNAGISFGEGSKVMMQVSPGKEFELERAQQWLISNEAVIAKQILSSVRAR